MVELSVEAGGWEIVGEVLREEISLGEERYGRGTWQEA